MGQFDDENVIRLHGVVSKCEWEGLVGGVSQWGRWVGLVGVTSG